MDTYIVRVYRRDQKEGEGFAGLVEVVESEEKSAFSTVDEFLEIFHLRGKKPAATKKRRGEKSNLKAKKEKKDERLE